MVHYYNNTYIIFLTGNIVKCITGDSNGNLRAQIPNPAVSDEPLTQIMAWKSEGALIDDIITRLRMRTVPARHAHTIHSWIDGK